MRVYLLRHGATEATAEGRYSGRLDTPLSPAGRQALHRAAFSPQYVYVSPLRRAVETAALGFRKRNRFRCRSCGKWISGFLRGAPGGSFRTTQPTEPGWTAAPGAIPGGESKAVFCARVCNAVAALLDWEAARQTDTVVVAHGGTLMAALECFGLPRRAYFDWRVKLGGGFVLDGSTWAENRTLKVLKEVNITNGD